jgi:hypothetical protein
MTITLASHPTKYGGGDKYNHLTIRFLHKPAYIYHFVHNNGAHRLLNIIRKAEIFSFEITAFSTMGFIQRHCGILSDTGA